LNHKGFREVLQIGRQKRRGIIFSNLAVFELSGKMDCRATLAMTSKHFCCDLLDAPKNYCLQRAYCAGGN